MSSLSLSHVSAISHGGRSHAVATKLNGRIHDPLIVERTGYDEGKHAQQDCNIPSQRTPENGKRDGIYVTTDKQATTIL